MADEETIEQQVQDKMLSMAVNEARRAEARREADAAAVHFAALPAAGKDFYRDLARAIPGRAPDLDALAARRAWIDAGRANRIAMDAIGGRLLAQSEAMMRAKLEIEKDGEK